MTEAETWPHFARGVVDVLGPDYMDYDEREFIKFPVKLRALRDGTPAALAEAQPFLRVPIRNIRNVRCMYLGPDVWTRVTAAFARDIPDDDRAKLDYARAVFFCANLRWPYEDPPLKEGEARLYLIPRVRAWMTEYLKSKFRDPVSVVEDNGEGEMYVSMGPGDLELCETLLCPPRADPIDYEERNTRWCTEMPEYVAEAIKELWMSEDYIDLIVEELAGIVYRTRVTREEVERVANKLPRKAGDRTFDYHTRRIIRRMWHENDDHAAKRIVREMKERFGEVVLIRKVKWLHKQVYEDKLLKKDNTWMTLNVEENILRFCTGSGFSPDTVRSYVHVALLYQNNRLFRERVEMWAVLTRGVEESYTPEELFGFLRILFPKEDTKLKRWPVYALINNVRQDFVFREMKKVGNSDIDDFRRIWFERGWGERTVEQWNADPVLTAAERHQHPIEQGQFSKGLVDPTVGAPKKLCQYFPTKTN